MTLSFLSVCSGIEAASVAWCPLGWRAALVSEIDPFPVRVLKARHGAHDVRRFRPATDHVPLWGDFTALRARHLRRLGIAPDVLVGGTPCQSFSVAGIAKVARRCARQSHPAFRKACSCNSVSSMGRLGKCPRRPLHRRQCLRLFLGRTCRRRRCRHTSGSDRRADEVTASGNGLRAVDTLSSTTTETKPGSSSTDLKDTSQNGRVQVWLPGHGAGAAWRVFDAQHFGLAQRRKRVFVVASPLGWGDPAAVLFEPAGLFGHHSASGEAGEGVAEGTGVSFGHDGERCHKIAPALTSSGRGVSRPGETRGQDPVIAMDEGPVTVAGSVSSKWAKGAGGPAGDECYNLVAPPSRPIPTTTTMRAKTGWSSRMRCAARVLTPAKMEGPRYAFGAGLCHPRACNIRESRRRP